MATYKIHAPLTFTPSINADLGLWQKYLVFVDSQKANSVGWWVGSLLLQGCLFVPLTFLLVYTLDGPAAIFLFISMISFFINVIANMGGVGFRFTFNSFMVSIVLHIAMVLTTLVIAL